MGREPSGAIGPGRFRPEPAACVLREMVNEWRISDDHERRDGEFSTVADQRRQ